jgi:hypothetical protein
MSDSQAQKIFGYGMITILSILLWTPFVDYFNGATFPSDSVGTALGLFFWLVYPVIVIYCVYMTIVSLLEGLY